MSQTDLIAQFQAISGKNEALSKGFLQTANWNLEVRSNPFSIHSHLIKIQLALSNYFGSNDYAPPEENSNSTIMDTTPPSSAPVLQPQNVTVVIPAIVDDDDSTIGLFVKGSKTPVRIHTLYHSPAYNPEDTAESVDSQSGYN